MKFMEKREVFILIMIILIAYLLIGTIFTILRANTYYDYFVVKPDFIGDTDKSYWDNRCIESNRNSPFPYAQWCVNGFGNYQIEKPDKIAWYFHLYLKRLSDWFVVLFGWPLHFLGVDLIKFRSVGNAF